MEDELCLLCHTILLELLEPLPLRLVGCAQLAVFAATAARCILLRLHSGTHLAPCADAVTIPVIASSGAGAPEHFSEVFQKTRAAAALAAGIFHRREVRAGWQGVGGGLRNC